MIEDILKRSTYVWEKNNGPNRSKRRYRSGSCRALAKEYQLVLVGRLREKISRIGRELKIPYYVVDFANLEQVKQLWETLVNTYLEIYVLANNAGAVMGERELSRDGFEKTFQVNHLAPFV